MKLELLAAIRCRSTRLGVCCDWRVSHHARDGRSEVLGAAAVVADVATAVFLGNVRCSRLRCEDRNVASCHHRLITCCIHRVNYEWKVDLESFGQLRTTSLAVINPLSQLGSAGVATSAVLRIVEISCAPRPARSGRGGRLAGAEPPKFTSP